MKIPEATDSSQELSRTRQARREQLIEVAQELFLADGYHATSMERVAAHAKVSKATLYKYFADKDELFLALVREHRIAPNQELWDDYRATLERTLTQLAHTGSRQEMASALIELFQKASARRNDVFYRLVVEINFDQPRLMQQIRSEIGSRLDRTLALSKEASVNLPAEMGGDVLLHLLFATITGYSVLEGVLFGGGRIDPEQLAQAIAGLLGAAIDEEAARRASAAPLPETSAPSWAESRI